MASTLRIVRENPCDEPIQLAVDEDLHLVWCERRNRPLWEDATFSLRSVLVTGGGLRPRTYGPTDPWLEPCCDPRDAYTTVGGRLKRHAEPDRDYDRERHVLGSASTVV